VTSALSQPANEIPLCQLLLRVMPAPAYYHTPLQGREGGYKDRGSATKRPRDKASPWRYHRRDQGAWQYWRGDCFGDVTLRLSPQLVSEAPLTLQGKLQGANFLPELDQRAASIAYGGKASPWRHHRREQGACQSWRGLTISLRL
jgi:hypothetical protein